MACVLYSYIIHLIKIISLSNLIIFEIQRTYEKVCPHIPLQSTHSYHQGNSAENSVSPC
jgi:hypothetical protein